MKANMYSKKISKDILIITKTFSIFRCLLGIQTVKFEKNDITTIGKFYKIYSLVLFVTLSLIFIQNLFHSLLFNWNGKASFMILIYIFHFLSYLIFYSLVVLTQLPKNIKTILKKFKLMTAINKITFVTYKNENKNLKISLYLWHFFYITNAILYCMLDHFIWKDDRWYWIFHFFHFLMDLVLSYFVIEVSMSARLFEKYNFVLINFELRDSKCTTSIKFNLQNSIFVKEISHFENDQM